MVSKDSLLLLLYVYAQFFRLEEEPSLVLVLTRADIV